MAVKLSLELEGLCDQESSSGGSGTRRFFARVDPRNPPPQQPPDDTSPPAELLFANRQDPPGQNRAGGPLVEVPVEVPGGQIRTQSLEVGTPPASERYSGFVVLRLSPLVPVLEPIPKRDGSGFRSGARCPPGSENRLEDLARSLRLKGLRQVLERFGEPPSSRAITLTEAVSQPCEHQNGCRCPVSLSQLERQAATSDLPPRQSLWSYFRLDARGLELLGPEAKVITQENGAPYSESQLAQLLAEQLNDLSVVDLAYRELAASDPSSHEPSASPEELSDFQIYLGRFGLDALWAHDQFGDRNGLPTLNLADIEQGWLPSHEDIASSLPVNPGDNRHDVSSYRGNHGTAVVGELAAKADNERGVVGIVNGNAEVKLASHYLNSDPTNDDSDPSNGHVANAIVGLLTGQPELRAGDALLLEVQRGGQPTEVESLDFDAIRLASAVGVVVVEAAGNGGLDLDRLHTEDGRSLDRNNFRFRDSGAIMVGASRPEAPFERALFSNFGSRLDCFGWGGGVTTTGYGNFLDDGEQSAYTDSFSGTSSAAPMIAGAAVLVQDLYRVNAAPEGLPPTLTASQVEGWRRLSPQQVRNLLSDPQSGVRQGPSVPGFIGVMPNLRLVLDQALGIVPRVYLRDHHGDTGETPFRRRECSCPDIVVSESPGGGSQVHLQLRNRGLKTAQVSGVQIYSAPVSTLITPDRWVLAGDIPGINVPQGDRAASTANLPLPGDLPACLIATVEYRGGPEVLRACNDIGSFDWSQFLEQMSTQNHLALRNVHDVDVNEVSSTNPVCFQVNGAPDTPRTFELQLIQRLPQGVSVRLKAQLGLALKFRSGRLWPVRREEDDCAILYLPRTPRFRLGTVTLPPGIDFPCSFHLEGADNIGSESTDESIFNSLAIRQLYRGQEVGRITWFFRRAE